MCINLRSFCSGCLLLLFIALETAELLLLLYQRIFSSDVFAVQLAVSQFSPNLTHPAAISSLATYTPPTDRFSSSNYMDIQLPGAAHTIIDLIIIILIIIVTRDVYNDKLPKDTFHCCRRVRLPSSRRRVATNSRLVQCAKEIASDRLGIYYRYLTLIIQIHTCLLPILHTNTQYIIMEV